MRALREVVGLASAAGRLWGRCLVPLLVCLLVGQLLYEGLFTASWRLGARDERIGLPLLAVAQLASLGALVAMFLVVGRRLPGIRSDGGRALDAVVLVLAPFLAFYPLWGLLEPIVADHTWLALSHEVGGEGSGTRVGAASWQNYLPIAAAAWVVKSVLVRLHRRGLVLTALVAVLEAVWLFLTFWALTGAANSTVDWLGQRAVWHWVADGWDSIAGWFGQFALPFSLTLPEILGTLWEWWREVVWPGLKDAVAQPLVWLAITALIYRRRVHESRTVERAVGGLRRDRRFVVDLLTRDYRDKYLPLVAAFRSVLRVGLPFLAALCLLYAGLEALADWLFVWAVALLDSTIQQPDYLTGVLDLGHQAFFEPLQVCLLAAAYERMSSSATGSSDRIVTRGRAEPAASSGTSAATVKT